jgi:hypothetical protein
MSLSTFTSSLLTLMKCAGSDGPKRGVWLPTKVLDGLITAHFSRELLLLKTVLYSAARRPPACSARSHFRFECPIQHKSYLCGIRSSTKFLQSGRERRSVVATLSKPFETTVRTSGSRPTATLGQLVYAWSSNTLWEAGISRLYAPQQSVPNRKSYVSRTFYQRR